MLAGNMTPMRECESDHTAIAENTYNHYQCVLRRQLSIAHLELDSLLLLLAKACASHAYIKGPVL